MTLTTTAKNKETACSQNTACRYRQVGYLWIINLLLLYVHTSVRRNDIMHCMYVFDVSQETITNGSVAFVDKPQFPLLVYQVINEFISNCLVSNNKPSKKIRVDSHIHWPIQMHLNPLLLSRKTESNRLQIKKNSKSNRVKIKKKSKSNRIKIKKKSKSKRNRTRMALKSISESKVAFHCLLCIRPFQLQWPPAQFPSYFNGNSPYADNQFGPIYCIFFRTIVPDIWDQLKRSPRRFLRALDSHQ